MGDEVTKWKKFKPGSIVRIELYNFMIYEHVLFVPGPFLNLVLGPNGSGKSAIVCAIIMGFAGDPQVTGRSSNLADYVRFGCHSASIHIEMYSGDVNKPNMIIERQFRIVSKNGKNECQTTWKLNGKLVQKNAISEFIQSLNIDINNLCQVLPQERVVEFSRLSPKELLVSTEKSIGDVHMYERHMQLITLSKEVGGLKSKITSCHNLIMQYQNRKTTIEPDLQLIQQKKKFEEELEWLIKKKFWLDYENKREEYMELKDEFMRKKNELNAAGERMKPIRKHIDDCELFLKKLQSQRKRSSIAMQQSYQKISKLTADMDEIAKQIAKTIDTYNENIEKEKRCKDKLVQEESKKRNFENELQNFADNEQFEARVNALKEELKLIENELGQITAESKALENKIFKFTLDRKQLEARKEKLSDTFNLRIAKISEMDNSTRVACDWLRKNRNRFNGDVYDPIITYINVKKPEFVVYVETAIGSNDMSTFLFERSDDLQKFCEDLQNECNIRVNVAMLPRNFPIEKCDCEFNLEAYKKFGIFASVRDLFTAPDKVMAYLCKTYHLNKIPVGNDVTQKKIEELMDNFSFRRIFTSNNLYSIVISQYDHQKSSKIIPLQEPRYLNVIINEEEVTEVNRKLVQVQSILAESETSLEEAKKKSEKLKEAKQMKRQELGQCQSKQQAIELHECRIRAIENKIQELKGQLSTFVQEKESVANVLTRFQTDQVRLLNEVATLIKGCVEKSSTECVSSSKIRMVKNLHSLYQQSLYALNTELVYIRDELKGLEESVRKARDTAKEARDLAKTKTGFDFSSGSKIDEEVSKKFEDMPDNLTELEGAINVMKLRCQGIANIDDSVLAEYQKYLQQIAEKSNECAQLENQLAQKEEEIRTIKPLWLDALNMLIGRIDENFSKFMEHLNFSGQVYLHESTKEYAFDEYGIKIKVKFREEEPMKDLDAYHQSGGERSVSTMVYMLSLQELANVPFRVVDEINQGMDDRNERLVFDLISEVSRRNSSQYFLLSPKLLPKLNYTRDMTIHIIMNGPYIFADMYKLTQQLVKQKPGLCA